MQLAVSFNEQAWQVLQARYADGIVRWLNGLLALDGGLGTSFFLCHDLQVLDVQFGTATPTLSDDRVEYKCADLSPLSIALQGEVAVPSSAAWDSDGLSGIDFWSGLVSTLAQAVQLPFTVDVRLVGARFRWSITDDRLLLDPAALLDFDVRACLAGTFSDWLSQRLKSRLLRRLLDLLTVDGVALPHDWPENLALWIHSSSTPAEHLHRPARHPTSPPSIARTVQKSVRSVRFTRL